MTEELIEEYRTLAREMKKALEAAAQEIPPGIFGNKAEYKLTREDYRQLGTSLFIEKHYASRRNNSNGDYEGKITENQEKFIGILLTEKKDSVDILAGFLDANDKELVKDLTASEASSLIDTLKSLKKK